MKALKHALVGGALLLGAAMPASAADVYSKEGGLKDEPYAYAPISWTGFYIGVTAGGAWGESRFDDEGYVSNGFDVEGFTGGVTAGYNFAIHSSWVVGVEADISSGIDGSFGPGNLGMPNGDSWGCGSGACVTDINWYGTLRGRVGYSFGNLLVYGTGGLAYGDVDSEIENGGSPWQVDDINFGWTAGGGVEYAITSNLSAKIEYLHVDLGFTDYNDTEFRSDAEFDVVRAGLNYRFGGGQDEPLK